MSLSACDVQAFTISNPTKEAVKRKHHGDKNPLTTTALLSGSCSGVHLCPGGSYCPNPAERRPCEPGRWCPEGSIKSQPCNITVSSTDFQALDLQVHPGCNEGFSRWTVEVGKSSHHSAVQTNHRMCIALVHTTRVGKREIVCITSHHV
jgi:hypothetical protein